MNFFKKFRDFISHPTHSRTMGLLAVLILITAVSLTVIVAQQQQSIKQKAAAQECTVTPAWDPASLPSKPYKIFFLSGPKFLDTIDGINDTFYTFNNVDPGTYTFSVSSNIYNSIEVTEVADCVLAPACASSCNNNPNCITCGNGDVKCDTTDINQCPVFGPAIPTPTPIQIQVPRAGLGQSCGIDSQCESLKCGDFDEFGNGVCIAASPAFTTPTQVPRAGLGQFCTLASNCEAGLTCGNFDENGFGVCIASRVNTPTPTPTNTPIPVQTTIIPANCSSFIDTTSCFSQNRPQENTFACSWCVLGNNSGVCVSYGNACPQQVIPSIAQGDTIFVFQPFTLQGITGSKSHKDQNLTVYTYKSTDDPKSDTKGNNSFKKNVFGNSLKYNISNKNFSNSASINLGKIDAGSYKILVKSDKYLRRFVEVIAIPANGDTINFANPITLSAGDIDNNNVIDIQDYEAIRACFGSRVSTFSCVFKEASDLNDDGVVDGIDYNTFVKNFNLTAD